MIILTIPILTNITNQLESSSGNMWIAALGIMVAFMLVMMIVGVDFRYAVMLVSPGLIIFSDIGWIPVWIGGLIFILFIGFGAYMAYNRLKES